MCVQNSLIPVTLHNLDIDNYGRQPSVLHFLEQIIIISRGDLKNSKNRVQSWTELVQSYDLFLPWISHQWRQT